MKRMCELRTNSTRQSLRPEREQYRHRLLSQRDALSGVPQLDGIGERGQHRMVRVSGARDQTYRDLKHPRTSDTLPLVPVDRLG